MRVAELGKEGGTQSQPSNARQPGSQAHLPEVLPVKRMLVTTLAGTAFN